ncbi:MAG: hypothetical protein AB1758_15965 [Candidatus Eremiobacterota bacterium]
MRRILANFFLTVCLVAGGYSGWVLPSKLDDHDLRMDNLTFGTTASPSNPIMTGRPGSSYWLSFNLRGCTPDPNLTCKGEVRVSVEGPAPRPLTNLETLGGEFNFQKRTGRTFLDYQTRGQIGPTAPPGKYRLVLEAEDHVSGRRDRKVLDFEVLP